MIKVVTLSVCKYIKEDATHLIEESLDKNSQNIPLISSWMARLEALDPKLRTHFIPINQALKEALEKVSFYAQYQTL